MTFLGEVARMTFLGEVARMTFKPHEHQREVRKARQAIVFDPRLGIEALASQSHGHRLRLNCGRIADS